MKKLLVLGGSKAQVQLIEAAKNEGYSIVLCDFTTTNPGIALADRHYQVDFMDRESVLKIASSEGVSGVVSNSEAAMLNVAFISECLGLVGNKEESIRCFTNKKRFRDLQDKLGLYAPKHYLTTSSDEAISIIKQNKEPFIIKPCESSGSRGTTKVTNEFNDSTIKALWNECRSFSRNSQVVIEEFVPMDSLTMYEGDIFVLGDTIIWDGLYFTYRSRFAPMVPMTSSCPLIIGEFQMSILKETVSKVLKGAGIRHGEFNIEMYFTNHNELFIIEVNARQGGNKLPVLIQQAYSIDMNRLLVTTAMGDNTYFDRIGTESREKHFITRQLVFSRVDGIFDHVFISKDIRPYVFFVDYFKQAGDLVHQCQNASDVICRVDLEFPDFRIQSQINERIEDYIYPIVW